LRIILLRLCLLCLSLLVAVSMIEIGLRMFGDVTDVPLMFWDPLLGVRRMPHQSGRLRFRSMVRGEYRFNAQGWNNLRDYSTIKPPGTQRVCIVGDSFVEAMQVPVGKACFSIAEGLMNRPDRPVEWYSFGSSGLGTAHEYLIIKHYALDYKPDVVVMLFVTNDPVDCSPYLSPQEPWMAHVVLDEDGLLLPTLPAPYTPSWFNRLMVRLALVRYLKVQRGLFMQAPRGIAANQSSVREGMGAGSPQDPAVAGLSQEERVARTWRLIEALLAACKRECAERGAVFAVAFQGQRWEIEAAYAGRSYVPPPPEVDPHCLGERAYDMGRQYLEPLAKRLDIPYLDLTGAMIEEQKRTGRLYNFSPEDAHFSEVGHAGAGRAMAAWIEALWAAQRRSAGAT